MAKKANATQLTEYQRVELKSMRKDLKTVGGSIFAFPDTGLTLVVAATRYGSGAVKDANVIPKFYEVSAAYCNPDGDAFKKKTGAFLALNRWAYGHSVLIPSQGYATHDDVAQAFADMVAF